MTLAPIEPRPALELRPSVTTDEDRLRCWWRLQQKLMEQFNQTRPFKDRAAFLAFQADWDDRLLVVNREINRLKPLVYTLSQMQDEHAKVPPPFRAEGLAETKWDTDLKDHPLLVVSAREVGEFDPIQNFESDYDEVDAGGDIELAAGLATATTMDWSITSHVTRDFGAGHFGDYEHLYEVVIDGVYGGPGAAGPNLATDVDSYSKSADIRGLQIYYGDRFYLVHKKLGVTQDSDGPYVAAGVWRYFRETRVGSTVVLKIYDNVARGVGDLVDTQTIDDDGTACRYAYALASWESVTVGWHNSFRVRNLDLQESIARPKVGGSLAAGRAGLVR